MSEAVFDSVVGPALLAAGKVCEENGMSMTALVEYAPGQCASTETAANPGRDMQIAIMAVRCKGNVDGLIMGLMKYGRQHGHSSIFLKQLGVPLQPPVAAVGDAT